MNTPNDNTDNNQSNKNYSIEDKSNKKKGLFFKIFRFFLVFFVIIIILNFISKNKDSGGALNKNGNNQSNGIENIDDAINQIIDVSKEVESKSSASVYNGAYPKVDDIAF